MPIARINGVQTYYEDEGEGAPVLFIHGGFGGAESALYWKQSTFKGVLSPERFRVITYDRRGGGRSEFVQRHYDLKDLAADAYALLRHLGIEQAAVVGDSLGGMVAQRLALDFPQAVSSLLLCETGSHIFSVPARIKALLRAVRVLPVRPFFPLVRKHVLEPQFYDPLGPLTEEEIASRRRHHEEYKQRLRTLSEAELFCYSMGLLRNYAAFADVDLTAEVERLRMPIDIIHGTEDRVVGFEKGAGMLQHLPHANFHPVPGVGHGLFYYPEGRELARQLLEARAVEMLPSMAAGD